MIIVVRGVFQENNKYYSQVFLDECLYKLSIINNKKMWYYHKIDFNETSGSKGSDICH